MPELVTLAITLHYCYEASTLSLTQMEVAQEGPALLLLIMYREINNYSLHKIHDVFKIFCNKCIEIYDLKPGHFLSAAALAWKACLKKNRSRIRIIN